MRLLLLLVLIGTTLCFNGHSCPNPVFVRWPRVKLNFRAVSTGRLSLRACQSACSLGEDPVQPGKSLECAALNHHQSPDQFSHQCDVFQPHQLQNVDGFVEADDRFSFYWKYCVNTQRKCGGDYAFTYLSDRYMDANEVIRVRHTGSLEDCLSECLNEANFPCRSLSFNRTDGGCHLSANNQLTKPNAIKLNNNPNFRIDYYENNCYNLSESFKFSYECQEKGILVKIDSKFPYTGALYGLYDFFTCRIEPKEMTKFEYFFPSPTESKNCSDSIRYKGNDMVLEIVLSTDGVEPLYFITPDDMTFQAKCPISPKAAKVPQNNPINVQPQAPSTNDIDSDKFAASAHALFSLLSSENGPTKTTKREETPTTKTTKSIVTPQVTKDTFPLLLTTTSPLLMEDAPSSLVDDRIKNIDHKLAENRRDLNGQLMQLQQLMALRKLEGNPPNNTDHERTTELDKSTVMRRLLKDMLELAIKKLVQKTSLNMLSTHINSDFNLDGEPEGSGETDSHVVNETSSFSVDGTTHSMDEGSGMDVRVITRGKRSVQDDLTYNDLGEGAEETLAMKDYEDDNDADEESDGSGFDHEAYDYQEVTLGDAAGDLTDAEIANNNPTENKESMESASSQGHGQDKESIMDEDLNSKNSDEEGSGLDRDYYDEVSEDNSVLENDGNLQGDAHATVKKELQNEEMWKDKTNDETSPSESQGIGDTASQMQHVWNSMIGLLKEMGIGDLNELSDNDGKIDGQHMEFPFNDKSERSEEALDYYDFAETNSETDTKPDATFANNNLLDADAGKAVNIHTSLSTGNTAHGVQSPSATPTLIGRDQLGQVVTWVRGVPTDAPKVVSHEVEATPTPEDNEGEQTTIQTLHWVPPASREFSDDSPEETSENRPNVRPIARDGEDQPIRIPKRGYSRQTNALLESIVANENHDGIVVRDFAVENRQPANGFFANLGARESSPALGTSTTPASMSSSILCKIGPEEKNKLKDLLLEVLRENPALLRSFQEIPAARQNSSKQNTALRDRGLLISPQTTDNKPSGSVGRSIGLPRLPESALTHVKSRNTFPQYVPARTLVQVRQPGKAGGLLKTQPKSSVSKKLDVKHTGRTASQPRGTIRSFSQPRSNSNIRTRTGTSGYSNIKTRNTAVGNMRTASVGRISTRPLQKHRTVQTRQPPSAIKPLRGNTSNKTETGSQSVTSLQQRKKMVVRNGVVRMMFVDENGKEIVGDNLKNPQEETKSDRMIRTPSIHVPIDQLRVTKDIFFKLSDKQSKTRFASVVNTIDLPTNATRVVATSQLRSPSRDSRKPLMRHFPLPRVAARNQPRSKHTLRRTDRNETKTISHIKVTRGILGQQVDSPSELTREPVQDAEAKLTVRFHTPSPDMGDPRLERQGSPTLGNITVHFHTINSAAASVGTNSTNTTPTDKTTTLTTETVASTVLGTNMLGEAGENNSRILPTDVPHIAIERAALVETRQKTNNQNMQQQNTLEASQVERLPSTIQLATTSKPAAATTNKHPVFKNTSPSLATTTRHPPTPTRDPKGTSTHGVATSTTVKATTTGTRSPPTPTRTTSTVPHTTTRTTPKPTTTQKSTTTKPPTTSKVTTTAKATTTTKPTTTIKPTTSATTIKPTTTTKAPTTTKPATTTTKPSTVSSTAKATTVENNISHNVPISSHPTPPTPQLSNGIPVSMVNVAPPAHQPDSTPHPPSPQASTHNVARAPTQTSSDPVVVGPPGSHGSGRAEIVKNPVAFDVFHNGRVVEAVVVGSKITLDFTPHYPIPPRYMSVRGCQVEPIDSKYEWEKEPLPIIKDGCPADFVGLACQPRPTDHGVKVSIEAFRYQTTAHVQYTCLIRVCPFAECPESQCAAVEGCEAPSSLGVRARRSLSIEEIRRAIEADPKLQAQIGLPSLVGVPPNITVEQQLLALAGDHVVKRRLVVVNSEDQLKYYVRTGDLP